MLIRDLLEAAEDDVRRSGLADRFISKLTSYLFQMVKDGYTVNHLAKYVVSKDGPDGYPGVVSNDFGFSGGMLSGVLICFRHDDYPDVHGSAAPVEGGGVNGIRYVVQMDVNAKDIKSLMFGVSSEKGRTVLLHELQHVIDYIRFKKKSGITNRNIVRIKKIDTSSMSPDELRDHRKKEATTYHNDDLERNAFFHNIAEPILQRLRYQQSDSTALEFLDPMPDDFREYFKDILRHRHGVIKQHWDNLSEPAKRRDISRLKKLFDLSREWQEKLDAQKAKYADTNEVNT